MNEGWSQKHNNTASGSGEEREQLHGFVVLTVPLYGKALKQARPKLTQEEGVTLLLSFSLSHSAFRTENVVSSALVNLSLHLCGESNNMQTQRQADTHTNSCF